MIRYVAFLRAINIGGHGIIKMDGLRKLFEELDYKNVRTYIQTGNVIFETKETNLVSLTKKIEKYLQNSLGYEVYTMLRTIPEVEKIIKDNPFKKTKLDKTLHLYLTFLHDKPLMELKKSLSSFSDDIATFKTKEREVYTLYKRNNAKHPFSNNFVEKKLRVKATTRNWKVIDKVLAMAKD